MRVSTPAFWPALIAVAAIGLALRVAAARGGLWLDEAWSAIFARDVATPAGVFLSIHHDNNHHLNTLWLQVAGFDASPVCQRALSVACGTATIVVAGLVGARRGVATGLFSALLFAMSPLMVTFGSEARGYAAMMLALMTAALIVDRWLDDRAQPPPTLGLTIFAMLGMFAQMTMAFGLVALAGWVGLRVWQEAGLRPAMTATLRVMGLPLLIGALVVLAVLVLWPGTTGFQFGAFEPFSLATFHLGLHNMVEYAFGMGPASWLPVAAGAGAVGGLFLVRPERRWFYALAIFGLPGTIALLQLGNAGFPRYYLVSALALLLLAGEVIGIGWRKGGAARIVAVLGVVVFIAATASRDAEAISNLRGDPAAAVATMAARSPTGTTVALDRTRASAVIESAAAVAGYRAAIALCGRFLFVDRDGTQPFDPRPTHCGRAYGEVARGDPSGISGTHWRLYEAVPLP